MKIPLLGGTGEEDEADVSSQLTQNWYVHKSRSGKSKIVLYPTPGLIEFTDIGIGSIRGQIEYDENLFIVSNNELYEINSIGTGVLRGTLNTSVGRVEMAHNGPDNGQQILIVDGTNGYIYDSSTTTLTPIADADFPQTATHCEFFDGYFIVNDPSVTGQFTKSASYDGTTWATLEIATAERSPDKLQGLIVSNRQLWLIGTHTAEKWFNSGALDFPFEPDQSGFSEWGTIAPYSIVESSGMTFWLSQNDDGAGLIVATAGGTPQVIASPEVSSEIGDITDITDCYSYTYQYKQHNMIVFTFPSGQKTFVYDMLTQEWHTWSSKTLGYHRSSGHTYVFGKHLVGSPIDGKIYQLDWSTYTDDGDQITRIRRSQNIHGDDKAIRHHGVWIDIKEGVGDATTTDPQLLLRFKDSNGSWSNYKARSMGKIGEYNKKLIWRKMGRSKDRVYEISCTDPVNAVLVDSYARVEGDARELG
jgi:hypothetical protein